MRIILLGQLVLGTESYGVPDGGQDLFGNGTTDRVSLQRHLTPQRHVFSSQCTDDDNGNYSSEKNHRQEPGFDESDDKGSNKCSNRCQCQADFLRDAVLNQVCVGRDSGSDFASTELVEEADILAQYCCEILLSDLLGDVLSRIDEAYGGDVDCDELSDGQVDVVDGEMTELRCEIVTGQLTEEELLEDTSKLAEDDGHQGHDRTCGDTANAAECDDEQVITSCIAKEGAKIDFHGWDVELLFQNVSLVLGEVSQRIEIRF